jgi:hypothetical protein
VVEPAGVRAPYDRETPAVRQVKSQRERDLDAIALAQDKGVMLSQLDALAADPKLHPASLPVLEWFRAEVRDAASAARLAELVTLLPESGIRRRHWWQGEPEAIEADAWNEDDDEDAGYAYDDEDQADDEPPAVAVAPAALMPHQWPAGLSMEAPRRDGRCQVRDARRGRCTRPGTREVPLAVVCDDHYRILEAR